MMRQSDIIHHDGAIYGLYWQTAMDGRAWCRVRVMDSMGRVYQYPRYFRTKKAARLDILAQ